MLAGVLSALVVVAAVQVDGTTTCPPPALVAARLAQLLPGSADASERDRVRLSDEAGELVVVLTAPGGELLGTRRFARGYGCDDLAAAAAVSMAVLLSDVHPAYPSDAPMPVARPQADVDLRMAAPPPVERMPAAWSWGGGLALGLGGAVDQPAAAADLVALGWLRPGPIRSALRAELEAQSRRELALQEGKGEWRRWILGLGLERTLAPRSAGAGWLRGFATARLALLDLQGSGFMVNHRSRVLDPGAGAGLRAVARQGSWASWIEVALSLWPLGHDAVAGPGAGDLRRLPVFEAFLRVGAGWGAGR
jgi:hypothetical protein